jgi:hypothetical protein
MTNFEDADFVLGPGMEASCFDLDWLHAGSGIILPDTGGFLRSPAQRGFVVLLFGFAALVIIWLPPIMLVALTIVRVAAGPKLLIEVWIALMEEPGASEVGLVV